MAGGLGGGKGFMFFICNMELTTEGQGIVKSHMLLTDFRSSEPQKFISSKCRLKHGN